MSKVHPIFNAALHALQPPHDLGPQVEFDPWDDALMQDLFGKRMWKSIQALLITASQIKAIQGSFGDPDKARVYEQIVPELRNLWNSALDEFNDQ